MTYDDRVKKLFTEAIEIVSEQERIRFLEKQCGTDHQLRQELESLLLAAATGSEFLSGSAIPASAAAMASEILQSEEASAIGKLVGPYRIEKEIGRGGMVAVYLASRQYGT